MISTRRQGSVLRITCADREAASASGNGKATSQYQAVDALLAVYTGTGFATATKQSVDYAGETGEEAWHYTVATASANVAKAIQAAVQALDNAASIINIDAANRSWIDGQAAGTALPVKTITIH